MTQKYIANNGDRIKIMVIDNNTIKVLFRSTENKINQIIEL